jgi:hypothetical protein
MDVIKVPPRSVKEQRSCLPPLPGFEAARLDEGVRMEFILKVAPGKKRGFADGSHSDRAYNVVRVRDFDGPF